MRYPTLQISDIKLNINYSQIKKKKILNDDYSYILYDKSGNDQSNMKINLKPELNQLMDNFIEYNLIKNDKIELNINDVCGYIDDNELYYNFIVDNFNGVFLNIYNLEGFNYNKETISEMKNCIIKSESDDKIENKTFFDNLNNLYKTYSDNLIYKSYNNNINNNDFKFDNNEEKIDFGNPIVGGTKKRMYTIKNQRHLIENFVLNKEIIKDEKESDLSFNNNKSQRSNSNKISISSENSENELGFDFNDNKNILNEEKIDFLIKELNLEEKEEKPNNENS